MNFSKESDMKVVEIKEEGIGNYVYMCDGKVANLLKVRKDGSLLESLSIPLFFAESFASAITEIINGRGRKDDANPLPHGMGVFRFQEKYDSLYIFVRDGENFSIDRTLYLNRESNGVSFNGFLEVLRDLLEDFAKDATKTMEIRYSINDKEVLMLTVPVAPSRPGFDPEYVADNEIHEHLKIEYKILED